MVATIIHQLGNMESFSGVRRLCDQRVNVKARKRKRTLKSSGLNYSPFREYQEFWWSKTIM